MPEKIIIFGFSGSGKSTLANRLGEKYGLRVVHPSGILRDLYENKKVDLAHTRYNQGFWESPEGIHLFQSRLKEEEPLDVISDKILLREIQKGKVVIDSWSLPWLTTLGYRIYLQADLDVRAKRVSLRSEISYQTAREIVMMKDRETTRLFQRLYGFNIEKDHNVFNLVVDTNKLSQEEVLVRVCGQLE